MLAYQFLPSILSNQITAELAIFALYFKSTLSRLHDLLGYEEQSNLWIRQLALICVYTKMSKTNNTLDKRGIGEKLAGLVKNIKGGNLQFCDLSKIIITEILNEAENETKITTFS